MDNVSRRDALKFGAATAGLAAVGTSIAGAAGATDDKADKKKGGGDDLMTEAEEKAEIEKVRKFMEKYGGQCNAPGCTCGGWVGGVNITKCRRRRCRHGLDYHI